MHPSTCTGRGAQAALDPRLRVGGCLVFVHVSCNRGWGLGFVLDWCRLCTCTVLLAGSCATQAAVGCDSSQCCCTLHPWPPALLTTGSQTTLLPSTSPPPTYSPALPPHPSPLPSPPTGVVTTLVTPEQLPALRSMAAELGISFAELAPLPPELPAEADAEEVEAARRGLEDLFNLY